MGKICSKNKSSNITQYEDILKARNISSSIETKRYLLKELKSSNNNTVKILEKLFLLQTYQILFYFMTKIIN